MKAEMNDSVRNLIVLTGGDIIPWEQLDTEGHRFGSFNENFLFVVDKRAAMPSLLTNTVIESLICRSLVVVDLFTAIERYLERKKILARERERIAREWQEFDNELRDVMKEFRTFIEGQ